MSVERAIPFLATVRSNREQRRIAFALLIVAIALFFVVAPYAKVPLPEIWAFLPFYQSAYGVVTGITAILLIGQFILLRARALLILAGGYLFCLLMAIVHAISFPGLLAPNGLFAAGRQSAAWLYFFWHGVFPLFVIGYAQVRGGKYDALPVGRRIIVEILVATFGVVVLAGGLTLLAISNVGDRLPEIMRENLDGPAKFVVASTTWMIGVVALVVLWTRRSQRLLDLWLIVVMCVWGLDCALAAVLNHGRFDVGWYAGRVFGLGAGVVVLAVLLLEGGSLYAELLLIRREELRQSSERLQASEGRFEATFEQAAVGIALMAPDGHWLRVNRKMCAMLGYSSGELLGKTFQDITHPDDLVTDLGQVQRMLAREIDTYSMEKRYFRKNGSLIWINLTVALVWTADGRPDYFVSVIEDISRRKDAEAAARESRRHLQLFIEHAPASIAMFDREMRYLAASRRWLSDYGLEGRDILGQSHYVVFPEIDADWKAVHRRGLDGQSTINDGEAFSRADGRVQWLRWEVHPWSAGEGTVGGIIIFSEDITERKNIEAELAVLNAGLERRVAERTTELATANQELDAFAYAVSHDLRAPLRALNGFSRALIEDYGAALPAEGLAFLHEIGRAANKMGDLINAILSLSRASREDVHWVDVDLSAMATKLLGDLARLDASRHMAWEVEPGLTVRGDPRMLEALMSNLLDNAWKYTAKTMDGHIRVTSEIRDGRRWFLVADNGAGFDMAHAAKLFMPFQRLHRQDEFPGIGIGLATVRRIVRRHGGEIEASGERGKGARFRFTLASVDPAADR